MWLSRTGRKEGSEGGKWQEKRGKRMEEWKEETEIGSFTPGEVSKRRHQSQSLTVKTKKLTHAKPIVTDMCAIL